MSVINKVLQDLDQRQAVNPNASVAGAAQSDSRLRRGTRSLASRMARFKFQAGPGQRRWLWWLALLPVLAAVAAGAWFVGGKGIGQQQQAPTLPDAPRLPTIASPAVPVESPPPVVVAPPVPEPVPAPTPVPEPVPTPAPAPAWEGLRMDSRLSANYVANTPPSDKAARPVEAAKPAQSPKAPASSTSNDSALPRRQQATFSDALAQAQSQWNAGLRAEAIALMEKTLTAAERNTNTQPDHANASLLVLVRELTRMHVAQGQFGAVWELLVRLEPLLGDQPDLWAIRANAAQRLGRHQDSVHAYMVALQSRPEEPRWLLGAAVSLAASGKTDSAAEMAEKARAHGTVSKDVLAYLRQLGVPLKD